MKYLIIGKDRPYIGEEDQFQIQTNNFLSRVLKHNPCFFHVANERKTDVKQNSKGQFYTPTGSKLKQKGVKRGVSDWMILAPRGVYHGLIIELKSTKRKYNDKKGKFDFTHGSLTPKQKEFLSTMSDNGYLSIACWGAEAFEACVKCYLSLQPGQQFREYGPSNFVAI